MKHQKKIYPNPFNFLFRSKMTTIMFIILKVQIVRDFVFMNHFLFPSDTHHYPFSDLGRPIRYSAFIIASSSKTSGTKD